MLLRILFPIIFTVLFTGCAPSAYVHITTQSDPEFISSSSDKVFVFSSDDDGVAQRKLAATLKNEMKVSGINVANSISEADYI